jgi:hypothetical protein
LRQPEYGWIVVKSFKKVKRLSWEMSDRGVAESSDVSVGIEVFVGVGVGGIDVGITDPAIFY